MNKSGILEELEVIYDDHDGNEVCETFQVESRLKDYVLSLEDALDDTYAEMAFYRDFYQTHFIRMSTAN